MKQTRNTAVSAAPRRGRADRRKAYVICTILASVFIIAMAVVLMSISDNRVYNDYMNQAQLLYYNKDYDGALSVLRKAASRAIMGRLPASRSPPQPVTVMMWPRPPSTSPMVESTFTSASGVCA